MEILPYIGVEKIKFGMTMNQVRDLWGQPDHIEYFTALKDKPEDRSVEWFYDCGIQLSFDSDNCFVLGSINIESRVALLNGLSVVGIDSNELEKRYPEVELDDDFGENGVDYTLDNLGLSFWVVDQIVSNVTLFPEYDKKGNEPIWPRLSS